MRRPLLAVGILFLVAFGALSLFRLRERDEQSTSSHDTGRGERIRDFWNQYNRAESARLRGDYQTAVREYEKALETDPRHQDSLFYLAVSLQESGGYPEAVATLRRLTELYAQDSRAFTQLGAVLSLRAPGAEPDFDAATEALTRSQQINREHSGPFVQQGLLELNRGNLEKAGEAFRVAGGGGAPEALFLAGLTEFLRGEDLPAIEKFLRVLEANRREKSITGRGMTSEGDVRRAAATGNLNVFERAGMKSLLFLYWTAARLGGYPGTVPQDFRLEGPSEVAAGRPFQAERLAEAESRRGVFLNFDRDGRADLLLTGPRGTTLLRGTTQGWKDVTGDSGLDRAWKGWDACVLDIEGDGWPDLYLVRSGCVGQGENVLFHNESGRFRDVSDSSGLSGSRSTAKAVAADLNRDGLPDILEVGNRSKESPAVRLYLNQGARFVDSAGALGIDYPAHAVDAAVADFDSDGHLDIFILGWKQPGRLYRNNGPRFADVTEDAGLRSVGGEGFSALVFDFNRDSKPDLLVTSHAAWETSLRRLLAPDITCERSTPRLFLNRGQEGFEEVTGAVGLNRCFGAMEALSGDFDGDGWTDVLFAQGGLDREHMEPSLILRNEEGRRLAEWAFLPSFEEPVNALGAAVSDIEGDGRPDVFLSGLGVLRNRPR